MEIFALRILMCSACLLSVCFAVFAIFVMYYLIRSFPMFHLEDIQEPLTPREFTRCAIAVVSRWCDNVLTGRYSSVESVGSKPDCLERIYKNR